jgi:hypothetical protein
VCLSFTILVQAKEGVPPSALPFMGAKRPPCHSKGSGQARIVGYPGVWQSAAVSDLGRLAVLERGRG